MNKATTELFKVASTPQALLDLGETGLKEYIKTIGLFNSKARNLIEEHRDALFVRLSEDSTAANRWDTAEGGGMVTSIGDDNLLMAYVHVAHDVHIGSNCVLSNAATLGGHVTVGDHAWIGASTGVHQFCRVGRHAIIGGYSVITQDVLPFSNTVTEREAKVFGANKTGLERRGFSAEQIEALHKAFRLLTRAGLIIQSEMT